MKQYLVNDSFLNKVQWLLHEVRALDPTIEEDPDACDNITELWATVLNTPEFEHNTEKASDIIGDAIALLEQARKEID